MFVRHLLTAPVAAIEYVFMPFMYVETLLPSYTPTISFRSFSFSEPLPIHVHFGGLYAVMTLPAEPEVAAPEVAPRRYLFVHSTTALFPTIVDVGMTLALIVIGPVMSNAAL